MATAKPIKRPDRKFSAKSFGMSISLPEGCVVSSQFRLLPDDNLGPDGNSIIEIDHVAIDEPETSGRHGGADGLRLIGAVNAVDGLAEIERTRAHGIAGPSGHKAGQVGLPRDHFRRRSPVGPLLLA